MITWPSDKLRNIVMNLLHELNQIFYNIDSTSDVSKKKIPSWLAIESTCELTH